MIVIFFLLIFLLCFWFHFYLPTYQANNEEASCTQVFFPFAIVHVCSGTIYLYLQDFNFICCYACFLLNNNYFFLLIFHLFLWFFFIFPGYRRRNIQQASSFPFCCHACLFYYYLFLFVRFYFCLLLCMFFFLIIVIFSYWFFNSVFGSFLFSQAIDEETFSRLIFFPFVVMHVCFITVCFYLQGSNFVCCYACFFLN